MQHHACTVRSFSRIGLDPGDNCTIRLSKGNMSCREWNNVQCSAAACLERNACLVCTDCPCMNNSGTDGDTGTINHPGGGGCADCGGGDPIFKGDAGFPGWGPPRVGGPLGEPRRQGWVPPRKAPSPGGIDAYDCGVHDPDPASSKPYYNLVQNAKTKALECIDLWLKRNRTNEKASIVDAIRTCISQISNTTLQIDGCTCYQIATGLPDKGPYDEIKCCDTANAGGWIGLGSGNKIVLCPKDIDNSKGRANAECWLAATLIHECGHAAGLGDSGPNGSPIFAGPLINEASAAAYEILQCCCPIESEEWFLKPYGWEGTEDWYK